MLDIDNKKYKYGPLEYKADGERSCYVPGRVYVYEPHPGRPHRGFLSDDLLLCIRKSGDCHYDFVRISQQNVTTYNELLGKPPYQLVAYFDLFDSISMYAGMNEAFPAMETLSDSDLVHILYSKQVLIPYMVTLDDSDILDLKKKWKLQSELNQLC